jgi:predicted DsbA family dithiol-disulfide isomerase
MDRRVRELGIGGVPYFIFEGRVAVSGAQEPATLLAAIEEARVA